MRVAARLAWSLWALSVALGAVAVVFYVLSASIPLEDRDRPPLYFLPVMMAAFLAYATVGALVASRRPGNAIGWILCAVGVLLGIIFFAQGYADYTLVVRPGSLPGGEALIWSVSFSGPALNAAAALLLLLFPNGHLPSPRWRPVAWLAVLAAMAAAGSAFRPGVPNDDYPTITNPVSIGGAFGDFLGLASAAGNILGTAAILLSAVAVVLRLRRARGEERQQLKWISYAGGPTLSACPRVSPDFLLASRCGRGFECLDASVERSAHTMAAPRDDARSTRRRLRVAGSRAC